MRKSTRVVVLLIVIEALLLATGVWLLGQLASGDLHPATNAADAAATIYTVLGGAMGVIAGVFGAVWLVLRKKERAL